MARFLNILIGVLLLAGLWYQVREDQKPTPPIGPAQHPPEPPNRASSMERSLFKYLAEHEGQGNYEFGEIHISPTNDPAFSTFVVHYRTRRAEVVKVTPEEAWEIIKERAGFTFAELKSESSSFVLTRPGRPANARGVVRGKLHFAHHGGSFNFTGHLIEDWKDTPAQGEVAGKVPEEIPRERWQTIHDITAPDFCENMARQLRL
jgi:hypothetical protein